MEKGVEARDWVARGWEARATEGEVKALAWVVREWEARATEVEVKALAAVVGACTQPQGCRRSFGRHK